MELLDIQPFKARLRGWLRGWVFSWANDPELNQFKAEDFYFFRMEKQLLSNSDLRQQYGLGRDLATHVARLLPHVKTGRSGRGERLLVRRTDFDLLIQRASDEQRDLWELVRDFTPEVMRRWLAADPLKETN